MEDVGKTHKKAKDLDSDIRNMLKKIQGEGKLHFSSTALFCSVYVSLCLVSTLFSFFSPIDCNGADYQRLNVCLIECVFLCV